MIEITHNNLPQAVTYNNLPEAVTKIFEKLNSIENKLDNQIIQPETDKLLTIKEASLEVKLSVATLYSYVSRNAIPFSKKSKRLYFSKQQLFAWVQEGRQKTHSELENEAKNFLKIKSGKSKMKR